MTYDEALRLYREIVGPGADGIAPDTNPESQQPCEPWSGSALMARLLADKTALSEPPPTCFGQPWYAVIEEQGPFNAMLSGSVPSWDAADHRQGVIYLEYLVLNGCPWGVIDGNDAAADLSAALSKLRGIDDGLSEDAALEKIHAALLMKPVYLVRFGNWPIFTLYLGRALRKGRRRDVEQAFLFRHSMDGTNRGITRVLNAGKATGRLAGHVDVTGTNQDTLSAYQKKRLHEQLVPGCNPTDNDWVEYVCDAWQLERREKAGVAGVKATHSHPVKEVSKT